MFINLTHIQQLFKDKKTIVHNPDEHLCLTGFQYLKMAPTSYTHHMVYLCDSLEELEKAPLLQNMNLLLVSDNIKKAETEFKSRITIPMGYLLIEGIEIMDVTLELQRFFDTSCAVGFLADTFMDYLIEDTSIQQIVEHAARNALKNPVLVFDASFNLIASYTDFPDNKLSESTHRLLANKGFSAAEFNQAKNSRIHERMMSSEEPITYYNEMVGNNQMLCSITTKRNWGHIVMDDTNHPFTPTDKMLFYLLKRVLHERMQKNEFLRNNKGYNYEHYLRDLLDGKIATNKNFMDRMNYFNADFSGNFFCLVVEGARSGNLVDIKHIRNQFENKLSNTKSLIYGDQLVVLFCMGNKQNLSKEDLKKATAICVDQGIYAGLSNQFSNITEIHDYYKQALRSIEIGIQYKNTPGMFRYQDYFMQHMMNLFIQKESAKTYCHPAMRTLLEYDEENQTQLADSLIEWIKCERNASAAADAMQIHRNTMIYRLKKIEELVTIDYDDIKERQYLALSHELNKAK
ncbi:MAG: helix-turn-helix domain-containing protein [Eubacterium sp.]|nr:helix-turn-helix domain-containing protein [Eubacterium sp.]